MGAIDDPARRRLHTLLDEVLDHGTAATAASITTFLAGCLWRLRPDAGAMVGTVRTFLGMGAVAPPAPTATVVDDDPIDVPFREVPPSSRRRSPAG